MPDWFEDGDGIYRVVLQATHDLSGDTQVNTLHYRSHEPLGSVGDNSGQSLADAIEDALFLDFAAFYTDDWTIQTPVVVQEKDPLAPDAPRSEWTSGAVSFGDAGGAEDLPRACCAIATLKSDAIGRRSTGRLFLGGSRQEADQASGVWQASALTIWQAFLDDIPREPDVASGVSEATMNWCVYSRTARAAHAPNYAFDIQQAILKPQVHWLRSRVQN